MSKRLKKILIFLCSISLFVFITVGCEKKKIEKVTPSIVLIYEDGYINREKNLPADNFLTLKYNGLPQKAPRAMLEYDGKLIEAEFNITYEDDEGRLFNEPAPQKVGQYSAFYTYAGNNQFYNASRKCVIYIEVRGV